LSAGLEKLITKASLEKLAGHRSFARGAAYFENGAVLDLVQTRDSIKARVLGGEEYRVALRPAGRALDWSCACPLGEEGAFCKHVVAAGLAWLERRSAGEAAGDAPNGDELENVRSYLGSQSKEAAVELLLEQAANDPELRAGLQAAALRHDPPLDLKALKETVRRALAVPGGFVDRPGMRAFLARADSAAQLLRDLLAKGRAADAVSLAGYAMRRGIAAYQKCDDSAGRFGDTLRRIVALHLEACGSAKPEGEALGAQLFELHELDEWGSSPSRTTRRFSARKASPAATPEDTEMETIEPADARLHRGPRPENALREAIDAWNVFKRTTATDRRIEWTT
jgi:hypothetical protein